MGSHLGTVHAFEKKDQACHFLYQQSVDYTKMIPSRIVFSIRNENLVFQATIHPLSEGVDRVVRRIGFEVLSGDRGLGKSILNQQVIPFFQKHGYWIERSIADQATSSPPVAKKTYRCSAPPNTGCVSPHQVFRKHLY